VLNFLANWRKRQTSVHVERNEDSVALLVNAWNFTKKNRKFFNFEHRLFCRNFNIEVTLADYLFVVELEYLSN